MEKISKQSMTESRTLDMEYLQPSPLNIGFRVSSSSIQPQLEGEEKKTAAAATEVKNADTTAAPANDAAPAVASTETKPVEEAAATAVDTSKVTISYDATADATVVKDTAATVIKELLVTAGETGCTISSTARSPEDQARAMYNNLESVGVDAQKKLYAAAGDKVIDVYVASKAAKKSADEIKADMTDKINELGPSTVSNHCADPNTLCVVDVKPSSITNKDKFIKAVEAEKRVSKFLQPPTDPAYHLEIPV